MIKSLKMGLLVLLVIMIAAITYFELSNGDDNNKKVISDAEIEERKKRVAQELFEEFKIIVEEIETKDPDNYDILDEYFVRASGKAHGILNIYKSYLTDDEGKWVSKKAKEIWNKMGSFSTIYFGYTKSGLQFIVLAPPTMTNNFHYADIMDEIRKNENETSLLFEIGRIRSKPQHNTYYALDVYVKDLLEYREEFKIEISISHDGETYYPTNEVNDQIDAILSNFERSLDNNNIVKDQQWKLYLFDKDFGWPVIKIKYEGEEIILSD